MTQETSRLSYGKLKITGMLGNLQSKVYDVLCDNPMTQGEVTKFLGLKKETISPRFAELKSKGVIEESCRRHCSVTGTLCIVWKVTGELPIKPMDRISSKQIILELKKRIVELEIELEKTRKSPVQAYLFADREL